MRSHDTGDVYLYVCDCNLVIMRHGLHPKKSGTKQFKTEFNMKEFAGESFDIRQFSGYIIILFIYTHASKHEWYRVG